MKRLKNLHQKLKRDNIQTEKEACNTHNKIGKIVRKAIEEADGTMPEDLPRPKEFETIRKRKQEKFTKAIN